MTLPAKVPWDIPSIPCEISMVYGMGRLNPVQYLLTGMGPGPRRDIPWNGTFVGPILGWYIFRISHIFVAYKIRSGMEQAQIQAYVCAWDLTHMYVCAWEPKLITHTTPWYGRDSQYLISSHIFPATRTYSWLVMQRYLYSYLRYLTEMPW